jgi:division protein CdvB (Snf7/Vps24/ESCRT-III family)
MKGVDKSNYIIVKRPQPWNVFGRLDAVESRLDAIESSLYALVSRLDAVESRLDAIETSINEIKMSQKMTAIMFVATQVPVWLMLLKK